MRFLAVKSIEFYQKYISPHKEFRCAASVMYGCPSCSQSVKEIIISDGVFGGRQKIREVFDNCKQAYAEYERKKEEFKSKACGVAEIGGECLEGCDPGNFDMGHCDIGDCDVGSCDL